MTNIIMYLNVSPLNIIEESTCIYVKNIVANRTFSNVQSQLQILMYLPICVVLYVKSMTKSVLLNLFYVCKQLSAFFTST
jgi:hypothetical protein